MTFFDKTFDELYEIISKINDEIWPDGGQEDIGLSFEFNDFFGRFKFNDIDLIDTENREEWIYLGEEVDEYEDIEICIRRLIKNLYSNDISERVLKL